MAAESVQVLDMPIGEVDGHSISYGPVTQLALDELRGYAYPLRPDSPEYFSQGYRQRERVEGPLSPSPNQGLKSSQILHYLLGPLVIASAGVYVDQKLRGFTGIGPGEKISGRRILHPRADTVYGAEPYRQGVINGVAATNDWLGLRVLGYESIISPLSQQERITAAQKCGGLVLGEFHTFVPTGSDVIRESRTVVGVFSPELGSAGVKALCSDLFTRQAEDFQAVSAVEEEIKMADIDRARQLVRASLAERDRFFADQLSFIEEPTRSFIEPGLTSS